MRFGTGERLEPRCIVKQNRTWTDWRAGKGFRASTGTRIGWDVSCNVKDDLMVACLTARRNPVGRSWTVVTGTAPGTWTRLYEVDVVSKGYWPCWRTEVLSMGRLTFRKHGSKGAPGLSERPDTR